MKTLIDINDRLLDKAMKLSQATTKKETVHLALEEFIKLNLRRKLSEMAGSGMLDWNLADLKRSRLKRQRTNARLKKGKR